MRIRNAALAGATALAVTFGGSTVAFAQDATPQDENTSSTTQDNGSSASNKNTNSEASLSSKIGSKVEGDQAADGTAIFGSSKDFSGQPEWAKILYGLTVVAGLGTLLGTIIGPVHNFFVHGPSF